MNAAELTPSCRATNETAFHTTINLLFDKQPPFWAMPSEFLTGQKAAAGIAAINSIGNLGGFLGPFLIGWARQATGSFTAGLMISAVTLLASAMFVISLRRSAKLSILQPAIQH